VEAAMTYFFLCKAPDPFFPAPSGADLLNDEGGPTPYLALFVAAEFELLWLILVLVGCRSGNGNGSGRGVGVDGVGDLGCDVVGIGARGCVVGRDGGGGGGGGDGDGVVVAVAVAAGDGHGISPDSSIAIPDDGILTGHNLPQPKALWGYRPASKHQWFYTVPYIPHSSTEWGWTGSWTKQAYRLGHQKSPRDVCVGPCAMVMASASQANDLFLILV
jgi:hypothetical protein